MYSTTISSESTTTLKSGSCHVIQPIWSAQSSSQIESHFRTLNDILSQKLCPEYLNQHHAPRSKKPQETIKTECVTYGNIIENTVEGAKPLDNKCYSLDYTLKQKVNDRLKIEKVIHEFQNSPMPWYIPKNKEQMIASYKRFYAYPKIAIQLEYAFEDYRKIIGFANDGISMFIVNLQYGSRRQHERTFKAIEKAIRKIEQNAYMDTEIVVIAEISDSKLMTGLLKHNVSAIYLDRDSQVILTSDRRFSHKGSHEIIYVNFTNFIQGMNQKDRIRIGYEIEVEVVEKLVSSIVCHVTTGGLLKPRTDIRIPHIINQLGPYISPEEDEDIRFILRYPFCDFISCPCAHNITICQYIRWFMTTHQKRIFILGKIQPDLYADETVIENIVQEFSGIWIDKRKVEAPTIVENIIINKCKAQGKPIVRSAHYIKDQHIKLPKDKLTRRNLLLYPDCLAIKSCTVNDINPLEVKSIIRASYPEMNDESLEYCCTFVPLQTSALHILIRQLALSVIFEKVSCIIMINNTGRSAALLSQNRITVPIIASVRDETIARRLLIWKNVVPILYYENLYCDWSEELDDRITFSVDHARRYGYISVNHVYAICFDSQRGLQFSDTFRLATINCWDETDADSN